MWVQRLIVLLLAIIALGLYHIDGVKNFGTVEAMDLAQLGRSLSEGRGFTTQIIRPLSLHLQSAKAVEQGRIPAASSPWPIQTFPIRPCTRLLWQCFSRCSLNDGFMVPRRAPIAARRPRLRWVV